MSEEDQSPTGAALRVLLVSDARSIHTARWANALAARGVQVALASVHDASGQSYDDRVEITRLPGDGSTGSLREYVRSVPALRRLIASFDPHVVNSHYASNNALLADLAVAGRRPHLVSVWGADVYDIPTAGPLPRMLVTANLRLATAIASTSRAMAKTTRRWSGRKPIFITPFGIDLARFAVRGAPTPDAAVRLGTVKTLLPKYGIDTLIEAFALALQQQHDLLLDIYGDGPQRPDLEALAQGLGVTDRVVFHGAIPHADVPGALARLDVYVALSRLDSESFGVAILEASACGVPVVVSDADGPAEVTVEGVTGFIVPRDDAAAAADRILRLARDPELRARMGQAGRRHVEESYSWDDSVEEMLDAYQRTIDRHAGRRPRVPAPRRSKP